MRALQPRAWLSGVGQACHAALITESLYSISSSSAQYYGEAEPQTDVQAGRDMDFLQLLSQSYLPATSEHSPPSSRPLLAQLPAAAELMERAVPHNASPQPVYDLPTFLNSAYPHAGVSPRNPAYDWQAWARTNLAVAPAAVAARGSVSPAPAALPRELRQQLLLGAAGAPASAAPPRSSSSCTSPQQQAALMAQVDRHMRLQESRQTLLRIAKLELAHLWSFQQQQHQQQRRQQQQQRAKGESEAPGQASASSAAAFPPPTAAPLGGSPLNAEPLEEAAAAERGQAAAAAAAGAEAAGAPSKGPAAAPAAAAAAAEGTEENDEDDDDDIFAAAERRAARQAAREAARLGELRQLERQQQVQRDSLSLLPPRVQLRLRELQRRAEGRHSEVAGDRKLEDVLREVARNFQRSVNVKEGAGEGEGAAATTGARGTGFDAADGQMYDMEAIVNAVSRAEALASSRRQDKAAHAAVLSGAARLQGAREGAGGGGGGDAADTANTPARIEYWAEHPALSYIDNVAALAHRESQASRREAAGGPDGRASVAAAVASLSAALRPPRRQPSSPAAAAASSAASSSPGEAEPQPPATPVLSLLLDYLQLKYQDLLHAWEVSARLQEATERLAEREAPGERAAVVRVQAGGLLPPALLSELESSWAAATAAFNPQSLGLPPSHPPPHRPAEPQPPPPAWTAPLPWHQAAALLRNLAVRQAEEAATAVTRTVVGAGSGDGGGSSGGGGDLRLAVQRALAPVLAAAAERHRALMPGSSGGGAAAVATAATPAPRPAVVVAAAATAAGPPAAAGGSVVCFREVLVLDASSGFEGGSHEPRVSLEFDLDRLAASEPALGGQWGRRFLERLLSAPMWSDRSLTRGSLAAASSTRGHSMFSRSRRGAAARSAAMAAVFPPDVEYRVSRRTGTAVLTTSRYGSREANRKLLLEHYAALLRATTTAAAAAAAS